MEDYMIEGIKLITHNTGGINKLDDPNFGSYLLTITLSVPEFMRVASLLLFGQERIVVRGKTREALEEFLAANNFRKHPRLVSCAIQETHR